MAKLILGDFSAERFWEDGNSARLPRMNVGDFQRIVMAMEELQVLFSNPDDIVYTRGAMDREWMEYLQHIGLKCVNRFPDAQCYEYGTSVSEILLHDGSKNESFEGMEIDPFAVDSYTQKAIEKYRLSGKIPGGREVQKVNSKIYSTKMREYLGLNNCAVEVHSMEDLENSIKELGNKAGSLLLKEEYGVSGQGNLLLQSASMAAKAISLIRRQAEKGREINFVVEPYLSKEADFSFQFYISQTGEYKPVSAYEIWNTGLAYRGSKNMGGKMRDVLEKSGYFSIMERVASRLFQDGYWGDVCVDSMLVENGRIEPIVEINARKSMGLLKHQADLFLSQFGTVGAFSFFNFYSDDDGSGFSAIEDCLKKNGLLFSQGKPKGIILLSEKTMHINKKEKGYQGRVYFLSAGENEAMAELLMEEFKKVMMSLKYNIF